MVLSGIFHREAVVLAVSVEEVLAAAEPVEAGKFSLEFKVSRVIFKTVLPVFKEERF